MPISFAMLLSLVTASNAENAETLWGFIRRYRPGVTPATHPKLNELVQYALNYYRDFVSPKKKLHYAQASERTALLELRNRLLKLPADASAEVIQDVVYEVGRREPFLDHKKQGKDGKPGVSLDWFNMLYQVLLGQERGPRFGSFVAAYGISNTTRMIYGALTRSAVGGPTFIPPTLRYRLYFDETGNSVVHDPHQRYLSLTGLVIRQDVHDVQVTQQLSQIRQKIFGNPSIVLHRRKIVGRKGPFGCLKDDHLLAGFNSQFAELVAELPATVITISVDKQALLNISSTNPYHYALLRLLEWFVGWLDKNEFYGDVVGEACRRKYDAELRMAFRYF
jgi:hypothetical protein